MRQLDLYDAPEWLQGVVALICLTGPLWVPAVVTAIMAALDAAVMG